MKVNSSYKPGPYVNEPMQADTQASYARRAEAFQKAIEDENLVPGDYAEMVAEIGHCMCCGPKWTGLHVGPDCNNTPLGWLYLPSGSDAKTIEAALVAIRTF